MHTQLNPNARLLCARHRQMRRAIRVFVDHHSSGFQRLRDLLGKRGVARPDRGAQAIGAVVGKIDSLLHCRKREDGQDGAKLFLRDQPASMRTGLSRPAHHGGTCSWQPMEVPSVRDIHRDPRLGTVGGPSRYSNKLLSVRDVGVRHHMQHARQVRWQSPISDAPLLNGRLPYGDPRPVRARRPLIMVLVV